MRLWGGRFSGEMGEDTLAFTASLRFDKRLWPYDLAVTRAHAVALQECGVLSGDELEAVLGALDGIEAELESGGFVFQEEDEDIHTALERALVEKAGEAGARLRTARSRNDQVAADMRLYVKKEATAAARLLLGLCQALLEQAEANLGVLMPGFTHLQPAQPVLLSHHLHAYLEMFRRDLERLGEARRRADVCPLGSGALAGVTFPLNRRLIADELGFAHISANSMDAVSDRDFLVDLVYALSMAAVHMSRLCEELVLWSSPQFGLVEPDDAYATGSSLMPQKKNPDVAELMRGKSAQAMGVLQQLLAMLKGLPLAYNRDLQEDKEATFALVDGMKSGMRALAGMVATLTFDAARMREMADRGFLNATDLADYLVRKGLPFLQAHEAAGKVVRACLLRGVRLEDLALEELSSMEPRIEADVFDHLRPEAAVEARDLHGGTATRQVRSALQEARSWLEEEAEAWRE
jgi:argininosuccinate lyase